MLMNGVLLAGNVLTGEPSRPVGQWDCPDCLVIVSDHSIDEEWGWQQWERQGNKRPEQPPQPTKEYRVALAFDLCDYAPGLLSFGCPQDFRVKAAHWQYAEFDMYHTAKSGERVLYHAFVYARRWKGQGKRSAELAHDEHPSQDDMLQLTRQALDNMGGLPVDPWHSEPMAWNDPLGEDDFLDPSDNPDDFDWIDQDDEEEIDF
jgi:hypothetical protein